MFEKYEAPILEIVTFSTDDVLTASVTAGGFDDEIGF